MQDIGFIGAGKVGTVLARYFKAQNFRVTGFFSSDFEHARESASLSACQTFENAAELLAASRVIFITVPDGQIQSVWAEIVSELRPEHLVFHCSGALTTAVFTPNPLQVATFSLHPLMAFSSKQQDLAEVSQAYFTIQSDSEKLPEVLELLAPIKNRLAVLSREDKVRYHAACVMSSNLVIGLLKSAQDLFAECHLPAEFIEQASLQLFAQNAGNIIENGLTASLTGPIARNDVATVAAHLEVLSKDQQILYRQLSRQLILLAKAQSPHSDQMELEEILGK